MKVKVEVEQENHATREFDIEVAALDPEQVATAILQHSHEYVATHPDYPLLLRYLLSMDITESGQQIEFSSVNVTYTATAT